MMEYITSASLDRKTEAWLRALAPFNRHTWEVDPSNSALLVVDCQNFFVSEPAPDGAPILPRIRALIDAFHRASRPVIFTRHMHRADGSDLGMMGQWWGQNIIEGTVESELHPSLDVRPNDIVLRKNVYSSFTTTNLDVILRQRGVKDVVIVGVLTNLCCETTARDAFCRDFRVFVPADTSGSVCEELHTASLMNIGFGFGAVQRSADILRTFAIAATAIASTALPL